MLGTSEQTAKISKTGFAKIGHTVVSKPQWVGFSSKKTGSEKFESWEKFFFIFLLQLFSPEPPYYFVHKYSLEVVEVENVGWLQLRKK